MATEAPFSVLPFLLLLLATIASASIEDVCGRAAARDKVINYDFCVKSLRAAPGGSSADDRGLAVIAGTLASEKAQATLPKIDDLLKSAGPAEKGPLEDCHELYDDAVSDLITAASFAKDNRYNDANTYFSKGIDAATTCEDGFSEKKVRSPLTEEDNELDQLSSIGAFITYPGP